MVLVAFGGVLGQQLRQHSSDTILGLQLYVSPRSGYLANVLIKVLVQLAIRGHQRTFATKASTMVASSRLHWLLRIGRLGHHLKLIESGQNVSPSQRYTGILRYDSTAALRPHS